MVLDWPMPSNKQQCEAIQGNAEPIFQRSLSGKQGETSYDLCRQYFRTNNTASPWNKQVQRIWIITKSQINSAYASLSLSCLSLRKQTSPRKQICNNMSIRRSLFLILSAYYIVEYKIYTHSTHMDNYILISSNLMTNAIHYLWLDGNGTQSSTSQKSAQCPNHAFRGLWTQQVSPIREINALQHQRTGLVLPIPYQWTGKMAPRGLWQLWMEQARMQNEQGLRNTQQAEISPWNLPWTISFKSGRSPKQSREGAIQLALCGLAPFFGFWKE